MDQEKRYTKAQLTELKKLWRATRAAGRQQISLTNSPAILTESANVIAFDLGVRIRTMTLIVKHKGRDQNFGGELLRHLREMKKEVSFCHKLNLFLLERLK